MTGFRSAVLGSMILAGVFARPLVAQAPAVATAIHTVSVTVAPRVRVQLAPVASIQSASPGYPEGGNVGVVVDANRSWVLAVTRRETAAGAQSSRLPRAGSLRTDRSTPILRSLPAPAETAVSLTLRDVSSAAGEATLRLVTLTAP